MFVVVASRHDKAAEALVTRWAAKGASLMTCQDMSVAGWRHYLSPAFEGGEMGIGGEGDGEKLSPPDSQPLNANSQQDSLAVVGGQVVAVEQITGVLNRLPFVFEQELFHIVPEDRTYVGTEMNAFLISWLSRLKCPVLNRPTPSYLLGPSWRPQEWIYAAAQLGIPVRPRRRQIGLAADVLSQVVEQPTVAVTVVGDRTLGEVEPILARHARRLADAAKVDLLTVYFSGREANADFVSADLWTDISAPDIADAIFEYLSGGVSKC